MKNKIFSFVLLSLLAACNPDKEQLEKDVVEIIKANPEVIIKSLQQYQVDQQKEQQNKLKGAVKENHDALYKDNHSLVIGNPDGDVSLAVFKDYRCGYCKRFWGTINKLVSEDPNVKVILKELPILGKDSQFASKLALASKNQGKYAEFYKNLIEHRGPWDQKTLLSIAKKLSIDTDKLVKDATDQKIAANIASNIQLARKIGITGTPAVTIGDNLYSGALTLDVLKGHIKTLRDQAENNKK